MNEFASGFATCKLIHSLLFTDGAALQAAEKSFLTFLEERGAQQIGYSSSSRSRMEKRRDSQAGV